jgi:glyoxylase-like metal-dependent hydrolase (beta-lactamase superfamily II)
MNHRIRVIKPSPGVLAFYEGRDEEYTYSAEKNWVDEGALSVGIASYAIVNGATAIVYDTHVSPDRAHFIRQYLEREGVREFVVVLSHHHLDHIAGTEAFSDCRIIANARTARHMARDRDAIERGELSGPPAVKPLVMPTETFEGEFVVGNVRLIETAIHSDDATVLWLDNERLLLAGDTLEDTVTFVTEPRELATHVGNLDALYALNPAAILPNHGDPDIIAAGGYDRTLIRATQQYVRMLLRCREDEALRQKPLAELIQGPLEAGWINFYAPYEAVHADNLAQVIAID